MVVKSPPGVQYRRFSVDEYHRIIDLAIFHEDLPVELIDGEIVVKGEYRSAPYRGTALIERYPFSRSEIRRLRSAGLLDPTDVVEQRGTEEWPTVTIGDPHCVCVDLLNNLLVPALAGRAWTRIQNPVIVAPSEPEPDVSVVRLRPDRYRAGKPQPADVYLIIEVADTSFEYDRDVKGPRYARNGMPEYWTIDFNSDTALVHRGPQPDGAWAAVTTRRRGDTLDVAALPGVSVAVADVLP